MYQLKHRNKFPWFPLLILAGLDVIVVIVVVVVVVTFVVILAIVVVNIFVD